MTNFWTTQVPTGSSYAKSGLAPATGHVENGVPMITYDTELIGDNPNDPLRTMSIQYPQRVLPQKLHVPSDMSWDGSWNGCWAFLAEDNVTMYQGQVLSLTRGGNPSSWYAEKPVQLYTEFFRGGHGGSGLSAYAGALRKGELTSALPISHKLKINVYGRRFLSQSNRGYHWPADRADYGYNLDLYPGMNGTVWFPQHEGDDNFYGGANLLMGMGTHLAVRRSESLQFVTEPRARKLAKCLRDYGAVIVDNTATNIHAICGEAGAFVESAATPADQAFHTQLMQVFTLLRVVL